MGRASFGGAGDYSGLFASLYNQADAEAKRATEAAVARTKQAIAAADDMAFSDWESGKISDEDLLAYIDRRISESSGEPTELAKWQKVRDQYRIQIADSKAEAAHGAGGDISDLIQYYESKMDGVESGSAAYRVAQQRVIQLRDQASEERFSNELNGLISRRASSQEILDFYAKWKDLSRPGSSLENKVQNAYAEKKSQIEVENADAKMAQIQFDFTRGKIGPAKYYNLIKEAASIFQTSDPSKYYQILESAFQNKRRSSGAAGADVVTALNSIEGLVDIWEANQVDGSAVLFNPISGKTETVTADMVRQYDKQYLKTANNLASGYKASGNSQKALEVYGAIGGYIAKHVQVHIGFDEADKLSDLVSNANNALNTALDSNDLFSPEAVIKQLASDFGTWANNLSVDANGKPRKDTNKTTVEMMNWTAKAQVALNVFVDPMSTQEQKSAALAMIDQSFSETQSVDEKLTSELKGISDVFTDNLLIPIEKSIAVIGELRSGKAIQYFDQYDGGRVKVATRAYVPGTESTLGPNGDVIVKDKLNETYVNAKGEPIFSGTFSDASFKPILIDINGKVTQMQALVEPTDLKVYHAIDPKTGKDLSDSNRNKLSGMSETELNKRVVPINVKAYTLVDERTGMTWTFIEELGGWVDKNFLDFGTNATEIDTVTGRKLIVPSENFTLKVKPQTTILPAPYLGKNPDAAQRYLESDPYLRGAVVTVDNDGNISPGGPTAGVYTSGTTGMSQPGVGVSSISNRDSWWNTETQEQIRRNKEREKNNSILQFRAGEREDLTRETPISSTTMPSPLGFIGAGMPSLLDLAKTIGINVGVPAQATQRPSAPPVTSEYAGINRAAALAAQTRQQALVPTIKQATVGSDYLLNIANANAAKASFSIPNTAVPQPTLTLGLGSISPTPASPNTQTTETLVKQPSYKTPTRVGRGRSVGRIAE